MKIFVTGAGGFVGRILTARLKAKGVEVIGVDIAGSPDADYAVADIRSREITRLIPEGVDAIIHLAGLTRNGDCQNKAYACFDANVMATLNLIDAAEMRKAKQFIFASSEWLYGEWKDASVIKNEDSPLHPHALVSEYAFSKLVSEVNLKQKFLHGFCPVTALRFGIIYGPREKNWSAVESLFNAVKTKDDVQVGSRKTGRCFIHVEDIVSGIIASIGLAGFNIIDLQGDRFITLGDIIEASKKILGRNPSVTETAPENFNIRNVRNAKAVELLKWKPRFGLEDGLRSLMSQDAALK